jgi:hypothetical protein
MFKPTVFACATVLCAIAATSCGDDSGSSSASVAAPTELKVESVEGGAHLTWKDNATNESEYMIERKSGAAAFNTIATVPFDTTQYHDASVVAGTSYVYRVVAMPKSGGEENGAYSKEVTFVAPSGSTGAGAAGSTGEHTGHASGAAGS